MSDNQDTIAPDEAEATMPAPRKSRKTQKTADKTAKSGSRRKSRLLPPKEETRNLSGTESGQEDSATDALSQPDARQFESSLNQDKISYSGAAKANRRKPKRKRGNNSEQTKAQDAQNSPQLHHPQKLQAIPESEKNLIPDKISDPLETAAAVSRVPALLPGASCPLAKRKPRKKQSSIPEKNKEAAPPPPKKRMFISVLPGEQIEVGLDENGLLLEYYLDMLHQRKIKGNIYKGIVHNIDINLQAAFVDYGGGKNGFLQIAEIHPEYWQANQESMEGRKFPPIQKALKLGQEVLVQVVKEPAGNKGAFLTTWLSLAGRFLVLTPGQEQIGVSRKVTKHEERDRLREMMSGIDPGQGLGVIVRTVGEGATKTTLKNDLQYLKRLWKDIRKKATEVSAPAQIYQEPGLSERAVRDYLTEDITEIWVDNKSEAEKVSAMVSLLFPRKKNLVRLYSGNGQSLWEYFDLEKQLDQIYSREVSLPSGGRLVFDQTEALMAIDINSGKISGKNNFEAMAYKTNMEASEAIARQLRLRDIGGQVVIDFIEMQEKKHVLDVEKKLRQSMKNDRARHDVSRMSAFGLLELVRQRMGSSALSICMETCAACGGTGLRRNLEWQALQTLRELRQKMLRSAGSEYILEVNQELGMYLLNHKRDSLSALETDFDKKLIIKIKF